MTEEHRSVLGALLLAPALLVTDIFSEGKRLILNERILEIAVAGVALLMRAPVLVPVALAVVTTALSRALT